MKSLTTKEVSFLALIVAFFLPMSAHADINVTELVTKISAQVSNVETIGLAILGVLVVIAGIALLRRIIH